MRNIYRLVSLETVTKATEEFFKGSDIDTYYINKLTDPKDPEHIKFKFEKISTGECFYTSSVQAFKKVPFCVGPIGVTIKTRNSYYTFLTV